MFNLQTFFIHIYESGLQYLLIYYLFSQYKVTVLRTDKVHIIV